MKGFRIIKKGDDKKMPVLQAKYITAGCIKVRSDFKIRLECEDGNWCIVYATKLLPEDFKKTARSPKSELQVDGGIYTGNSYSCPYCGNRDIVKCSSCGGITCYNGNGMFECKFCGNAGEVSGAIESLSVESGNEAKKGKK